MGVGCGAPINHTQLKEGETVVDLGSGAGIDIFLAARKVLDSGRAIGIDMTDDMLQKARENAKKGSYPNVEFKKGDIEENIPLNEQQKKIVESNNKNILVIACPGSGKTHTLISRYVNLVTIKN